jgi:hypothetical protein
VGGLDYSAVYQAVRRIESRAKEDKKLADRMEAFRGKLKRMYNVDSAEKPLARPMTPPASPPSFF